MIREFLVHTSTVEPHLGTGGRGAVYGPPSAPLPCLVEDESRLVRTAGEEVVSNTTVLYEPTVDIPVGSRVTFTVRGRTRTSTALVVSQPDSAGLTDLDHVEVALA